MLKGSKKGVKKGTFIFPANAVQAFQRLCEAFTTAPLLAHFDNKKLICIKTDALKFAILGILLQLQETR